MRSLIIGVIGGTKAAGAQALTWAPEVGRLIVNAGHILLTGGEPIPKEKSVKAKAMCAARDAGTALSPTGTIGIVPDKSGGVVLDESSSASYSLLLYTGVSNHERNVLNGFIPDVLIVLAGEAGTLSETAYAIVARRPLLFLGSRALLQESLARPGLKSDVRKIIDRLGETSYGSTEMVNVLERLLAAGTSDSAYPAFDVSSEPVKKSAELGINRGWG